MHFPYLILLYCMLIVSSSDLAPKYQLSSPTRILKCTNANPMITNDVEPEATNIIFQSKDAGQTWQDISDGLPENEPPEGFFAGDSDVYMRVKNVMYHSKHNLKTPVWEKDNVPDFLRSTSIAFNRSGVMVFNYEGYEGQIYRKAPAAETWLPIYTNSKIHSMRTIFETSDGKIFIGCDNGLYKSADRGKHWKLVLTESGGMDLAESEGVLIGTGQKGIMRSTDDGEHWEWVISEGGAGIAVERIEGGFAAISYNTTIQSRRIYISLDKGKTWTASDVGLQPSLTLSSVKQVGKYLLCGHPDGIFRSSDMGKTWNIVHPSVSGKIWNTAPGGDRKIFKLYVSGTVLFAVARDAGC